MNLVGHFGSVNCLKFSADNNYIVSGSKDNTIRIWNFNSSKEENRLIGHTD